MDDQTTKDADRLPDPASGGQNARKLHRRLGVTVVARHGRPEKMQSESGFSLGLGQAPQPETSVGVIAHDDGPFEGTGGSANIAQLSQHLAPGDQKPGSAIALA